MDSQVEKLPQHRHGILRSLDGVTRRPRIAVDFVVIPTLEALVSEEMDGLVMDAGQSF